MAYRTSSRVTTDSSASSSECIVEHQMKRDEDGRPRNGHKRLLDIVDVPTHLRFNGYIHGGYRPIMSAGSCFKSLGHFHNETLNILTHGIALLYIVFNASNLLPWKDINVPLLPYVHIVSIVAPWLGSTIYHLFMNVTSDEVTYKRLLLVDMIGIWIGQSFGPITTIYVSIYCLSRTARVFVFALYLLLSAVSLYKVLVARTPWERRLSFMLQYVTRICLYAIRTTSFGTGDYRVFTNVIVQDLLAVLAAVIGATFFPERFFPGKLDYLGNSHQIMHVLVIVSMFFFHWAVTLDLLWLSNGNTQCLR